MFYCKEWTSQGEKQKNCDLILADGDVALIERVWIDAAPWLPMMAL